jgi:hypothetical protein
MTGLSSTQRSFDAQIFCCSMVESALMKRWTSLVTPMARKAKLAKRMAHPEYPCRNQLVENW